MSIGPLGAFSAKNYDGIVVNLFNAKLSDTVATSLEDLVSNTEVRCERKDLQQICTVSTGEIQCNQPAPMLDQFAGL